MGASAACAEASSVGTAGAVSSRLPPRTVASVDQGEAADGAILDQLLVTYRDTRATASHTEALVAVTLASSVVISLGGGLRMSGALAVAVARLCEAEAS